MHVCVLLFRDNGVLPAGVEVVGSRLTVRGQVGLQHAGLYDCWISYYRVRAGLQFNVTVKPQDAQLSQSTAFTISSISLQVNTDIQPAFCCPSFTVPPTVHLHIEDGVIECSAANGVPAANMSWLLPEGVSEASWFNLTSPNGSYTVKSILPLPACSPRERAATCVINHPAFAAAEHRSVSFPVCGAFQRIRQQDILSSCRVFILPSPLPLLSLAFLWQLAQTSPSTRSPDGKTARNTPRWHALWTASLLQPS